MDGLPCIRGRRISVVTVVGTVAEEMSTAEILAAYPDLEAEDIEQAVRYAAETVLAQSASARAPGRASPMTRPRRSGLHACCVRVPRS